MALTLTGLLTWLRAREGRLPKQLICLVRS